MRENPACYGDHVRLMGYWRRIEIAANLLTLVP